RNLPLFDEESKILDDIIGLDQREREESEIQDEVLEETDTGAVAISNRQLIEIDQRYGKIQSKLGDIRREKEEFLNARRATRRIFYSKIFTLLEEKNFVEAAAEYYRLANTLSSTRRDLRTSSLLLLLYGMCLLKMKKSYTHIRENISIFLERLGINRRNVEDTFYVMTILFLIDVKEYNLKKYKPKLKGMLEILPLFEEELILIEN
ncbi:MAG: hypothetical protein ACFFFB_13870, partial [Candidatus Heimdallarchaeota archaeon]